MVVLYKGIGMYRESSKSYCFYHTS